MYNARARSLLVGGHKADIGADLLLLNKGFDEICDLDFAVAALIICRQTKGAVIFYFVTVGFILVCGPPSDISCFIGELSKTQKVYRGEKILEAAWLCMLIFFTRLKGLIRILWTIFLKLEIKRCNFFFFFSEPYPLFACDCTISLWKKSPARILRWRFPQNGDKGESSSNFL